ncbi:MAG: arginine repressor [Gemmatimonadota bacterium]
MGKSQRHAAIRQVVAEHRVASQEQLRELLLERNFDVTQATLSRDIRELRLVKMPDPDGGTYYTVPDTDLRPPLARLLPTLFVGVEGTGNLLVVKTLAGGAQAISEAIDWEEWTEILGTLAGDDTILVILRDSAHLPAVQKRIEELAGNA